MRGIIGWGSHVPHRRLDRTQIAPVAGTGGGKGTRTIASYDEDSTTMAVEAGRACLATVDVVPDSLWFATISLFGSMLEAGVVDEVDLTWAPTVVGGAHDRIVKAGDLDVALRPMTLVEEAGTLVGRWEVVPNPR